MSRPLERTSDAELLERPLRSLRLRVEDGPLRPRVERLHAELEARGLRFRPHVWFSTDWFSPDGVPGIAVPFFLGDPRLARLERRRHLTCEGWSEEECMRLLRHEAGHAIDTAFGLARRPAWRALFGRRSAPYRRAYTADPFATDFVRHLPRWYAQSHPAEDFAETFAVWLAGGGRGVSGDSGAGRKLAFVDATMRELAGRRAPALGRERPYSLATSDETIGDHYRRKAREHRREPAPAFEGLLEAFASPGTPRRASEVAAHVGRLEPSVRRTLLAGDAPTRYDVDQVLTGLAHHARTRGLTWSSRRRPRVTDLVDGVRSAWRRLREGEATLHR